MSRYKEFSQWSLTVATHLPHLSKPQAIVLALWSLGMVLARSCALTAVTTMVAALLGQSEATVRQRLREWYDDAPDKQGHQRVDLDVTTCFCPLLHWVLSWWHGTQLALALDATSLGSRFVVLAVCVLYRGCAIPVAWTVVEAQQSAPWRKAWLRMLRQLWPAVPSPMTVLVLADRGLYARWLFRRIVRLGWHPLLRVNAGGTFRPDGTSHHRPLTTFAPQPGTSWQGRGTAFTRQRQLACTLLAWWKAGTEGPWLLLTDLPPETGEACWYGLRAWIEQGFKVIKRAGWQWQRTRMTDPQRAERLWLAVAVATLWLLSVGGEADATLPESTVPDVTSLLQPQRRYRQATRLRLVGVFRRGWVRLLVALLRHDPLPLGHFLPEPWPEIPKISDDMATTQEVYYRAAS